MLVDLHCHSTLSDGVLTPLELVALATRNQVAMLAITDHDFACEKPEAELLARQCGVQLIAGIELSCLWMGMGVHLVGLNLDYQSGALRQMVAHQSQARAERAHSIADKLAKLKIEGSYAGAQRLAQGGQIGRPHFAQYLVEAGYVKDVKAAFKRYLGAGKAGDVKCHWPDMEQGINWIKAAGGHAVLAHPAKYKLSRRKLGLMCRDFKEMGGTGLELVSGLQTKEITQYHARLCSELELYASCGSDFHGPATAWQDLGKCSPMPSGVTPIWSLWQSSFVKDMVSSADQRQADE